MHAHFSWPSCNMPRLRTMLIICLVLATVIFIGIHIARGTLTIDPMSERNAMSLLEHTKAGVHLAPFTTDGCSGNISSAWNTSVKGLSHLFSDIDARYFDMQHIPFEDLCMAHDMLYHAGEGGYLGRLRADNTLRDGILDYAQRDLTSIKERTGLDTDEAALYLYELIAELVYHGVRLGGAPCSGQPYAWGYGYGGGTCVE